MYINRESWVSCSRIWIAHSADIISLLLQGDDPPRDRTSELRAHGFPTRHLGPVQMTTDTALGVTKLVVADRVPLNKIPYIVRTINYSWLHISLING